MGVFSALGNRVLVQLFKHLPFLAERWARRHPLVEGDGIPFAPPRRPLRDAVIGMVTTAGVHLRTQPPFDMSDPDGDPSFRVIPSDATAGDLVITHKYYDHSAADRDINVVLPIDRLRELRAEERIGGIAPFIYGFMGHIDGAHVRTLVEETAPEVARRLADDGAEGVFLTPA
jgi:D-proline reductase (dithiol) PrdB